MTNKINLNNDKLKKYFQKIFTKKNILWKTLFFFTAALIVFMPFFLIRDAMLKMKTQDFLFMGNFIEGHIESNTGVGLSILSNANPEIVYFVQIFFSLVPLLIFFLTSNKIADIGVLFMFFGGFSNIIDRATYDNFLYISNEPSIIPIDAVIDYWRFGFVKNSFIFNYADVFICIGAILLFIGIFLIFFKEIKEVDEREKKSIKKNERNKI